LGAEEGRRTGALRFGDMQDFQTPGCLDVWGSLFRGTGKRVEAAEGVVMTEPTVVVTQPGLSHEAVAPRSQRRVFDSLTLGVLLLVACVCGVVAIVSTHPFASMTATERISETIGHPASCTKVGVSALTGESATVYRCTVGAGAHASAQCFAVAGERVRQVSGLSRRLGC
jgi:hypothetical protein